MTVKATDPFAGPANPEGILGPNKPKEQAVEKGPIRVRQQNQTTHYQNQTVSTYSIVQ